MEVFRFNQNRIKRINQFMKLMIESNSTDKKVEAYQAFEKDIEKMTPLDMFYLHNYQQDSQLSIEEIKATANKFINVFHKGLENHAKNFSHPLTLKLIEEGQSIEHHLNHLKKYYQSGQVTPHKQELLNAFAECSNFEKKFIKFENIIFPNLEDKVPSTKPFEVLWSLHDDARQALNQLIKDLKDVTISNQTLIEKIGRYYHMIFGINQKEKLIILPLLETLLTEDVLNKLFNECLAYGYAFVETPKPIAIDGKEELTAKEKDGISFESGHLTFKQVNLIFNHLPVDITFVDKDDRVSYYNQRLERHFPRNPSVIGRLVKHCHPPKSVHVVEKIVDDFRKKKRDVAEFWIEINGVFLYITYYAVRDDKDVYQGVLEVSQDVTKIRQLQGEKRLL